jgi:hypothetical protein
MHTRPRSIKHLHSFVPTTLAIEVELGLAVGGERAPGGLVSSLSVVTDRGRLPWLVECLEVEAVEAPVKESTETVLEEVSRVVFSTLGSVEVGANYYTR